MKIVAGKTINCCVVVTSDCNWFETMIYSFPGTKSSKFIMFVRNSIITEYGLIYGQMYSSECLYHGWRVGRSAYHNGCFLFPILFKGFRYLYFHSFFYLRLSFLESTRTAGIDESSLYNWLRKDGQRLMTHWKYKM